VTARAVSVLAGAIASILWGWQEGWPELTAMGAAGGSIVILVVLVAGWRPRASIHLDRASLRVVRGQATTVRMSASVTRRRSWLHVVEGPVAMPTASVPLPPAGPGGTVELDVPVDTSRRGERAIGPYCIVQADPFGFIRRVVAQAEGGRLMVHPRSRVLARAALPSFSVGDTDLMSRRAGDQHFFALRDYVLGDEPRMVHWRSTARAGRLVVRQQVAAATTGTTIVLDTDVSAYGADTPFSSGRQGVRFEVAVEVAASLASSQTRASEQVHLITTQRAATVTSAPAGAPSPLLDALAVTNAVTSAMTNPAEILAVVRRTRCARVVVVTGTPSAELAQTIRALSRTAAATAVFRVGSKQRPDLGVEVVDVDRLEGLAAR
jgi:uncharacterized protein (DUF58 family)